MDLDAVFILELWESIRDKIPLKERDDAAYGFIKVISDWDVDVLTMRGLHDEDHHIDSALELLEEEDGGEEETDDYDE